MFNVTTRRKIAYRDFVRSFRALSAKTLTGFGAERGPGWCRRPLRRALPLPYPQLVWLLVALLAATTLHEYKRRRWYTCTDLSLSVPGTNTRTHLFEPLLEYGGERNGACIRTAAGGSHGQYYAHRTTLIKSRKIICGAGFLLVHFK